MVSEPIACLSLSCTRPEVWQGLAVPEVLKGGDC